MDNCYANVICKLVFDMHVNSILSLIEWSQDSSNDSTTSNLMLVYLTYLPTKTSLL